MAACYVRNEGKTDLPFLLPQFIDGILQTLCGLDDIIVGPEVGILEELHLIKEGVALVERITSLDRGDILLLTIGDHQFAHCREAGGEETLLPVAVEAEDILHITDTREHTIILEVY